MSQLASPDKTSSGVFVPVALSGMLLLALLVCLYYIWTLHTAHMSRLQAQAIVTEQNKNEAFSTEKNYLEGLLALPPCEAKDKLGSAVPVFSTIPSTDNKSSPSANIEKACVFIVSVDAKQNILTGTGFFIAPGYVVTNKHVVAKTADKVFLTNKALKKPIIGRVLLQDNNGGRDYAVVRVDEAQSAGTSVLFFADGAKRTDKIGAWGFPDIVGKNDPAYATLLGGEDITAVPELSYTEGVVSAILERQPRLIVHTAPISPGSSGGPLVNVAGDVVGINTMISLDEESYRQASMALSAQDLCQFLKAHNIPFRSRNAN